MVLVEYFYEEVSCDDISSTDLAAEAQRWQNLARCFKAARVHSWPHENEGFPYGPELEIVAIPSEGRLGITMGADASWGDYTPSHSDHDIEQAISDYLNDSDAWERRA